VGVKVYMGSSTKITSKDPQDNLKSAMSTALISYTGSHTTKKIRFSDIGIWDIFCPKNAPNDLATLY
jgi:hypothetical protein